MAGGPGTWSSKCQATEALSTIESKYIAMSQCAEQMVWMQSWLNKVKISHILPGLIKGNNRGAITNQEYQRLWEGQTNRYSTPLYLKSLCSGAIKVEHVSADTLADVLTKPLPRNQHHHILDALNIN